MYIDKGKNVSFKHDNDEWARIVEIETTLRTLNQKTPEGRKLGKKLRREKRALNSYGGARTRSSRYVQIDAPDAPPTFNVEGIDARVQGIARRAGVKTPPDRAYVENAPQRGKRKGKGDHAPAPDVARAIDALANEIESTLISPNVGVDVDVA